MAKKKSQKKSENIFDKKYAYIQLINGENLITQVVGIKKIEDKDEYGNIINEYKLYKIQSPYKVFEVFDRNVMKSTLVIWNPYIECSHDEFILTDDSFMFIDRHLKPDIILRYWQTMYLTHDECLEYSISKIEKDYIAFLERDPEKYYKLIESYSKSKEFSEDMRRISENLSSEPDDYEEDEEEFPVVEEKQRQRKRQQPRKNSRKKNTNFDNIVRAKIVEFFGTKKWIFEDNPDIMQDGEA